MDSPALAGVQRKAESHKRGRFSFEAGFGVAAFLWLPVYREYVEFLRSFLVDVWLMSSCEHTEIIAEII